MQPSERGTTNNSQAVDRNANVMGRGEALRILGLGFLGTIAAACSLSGPEPSPSGQLGIPSSKPARTAAPTASIDTGKATGKPGATDMPGEVRPGVYRLQNPDEGGKMDEVNIPEGFTPDPALHTSDIKPLSIGDLSQYDTPKSAHISDGSANGVGYNYDYNDFCQVPGFLCNQQMDMYAWRIDQGQEVKVPGIGTLKGGPRRSVVLLYFNLTDHVNAFDVDSHGPIYDKRGFTATGRIFNGDNIQNNERDLSGFWLYKQGHGEPSKSYIGITDSPDNALETLLVTVVRKQWGNNQDGTPRYEDQLVRAGIFKVQ